ncbi:glycine cleavage system protein GcvH [Brevibacterium sp. BRM-1]|uniref:glycine cleavage system protein GcvH n=1 Tax=Brevibacterium sp. BRM-1 TaxID=2999062 RepID=UPI002281F352|nr:glycine cleavage system protein GcvH [Brevibacterium sp. BRM-1]WAL41105.1 glycine cleavage system protein GcvH [Brevibacterium sp. BRM-1]
MATLDYPASLRYSSDHEWVASTDDADVVRVGITDFAQDSLGDVVYVDLPAVGDAVSAGDECGEVESTKSVSDIIAPISGEIVSINEDLDSAPETINTDPYGAGWLFTVRLAAQSGIDDLLDADAYSAEVGTGGA